MYDLVGNPEDRFSHNEAHLLHGVLRFFKIASKMLDKISTQLVHTLYEKADFSMFKCLCKKLDISCLSLFSWTGILKCLLSFDDFVVH